MAHAGRRGRLKHRRYVEVLNYQVVTNRSCVVYGWWRFDWDENAAKPCVHLCNICSIRLNGRPQHCGSVEEKVLPLQLTQMIQRLPGGCMSDNTTRSEPSSWDDAAELAQFTLNAIPKRLYRRVLEAAVPRSRFKRILSKLANCDLWILNRLVLLTGRSLKK